MAGGTRIEVTINMPLNFTDLDTVNIKVGGKPEAIKCLIIFIDCLSLPIIFASRHAMC